jgi:hypothetical protein
MTFTLNPLENFCLIDCDKYSKYKEACSTYRSLPWPSVLRIWDMFACEGVKVKVIFINIKKN